ncbi:hypothetical protein [Streptomyces sp. YIM 98790]|nr:hypothetical protein [Streptomyces sp. YIM 98790]
MVIEFTSRLDNGDRREATCIDRELSPACAFRLAAVHAAPFSSVQLAD